MVEELIIYSNLLLPFYLKKSSLTQNAHFLRQKRLGKHYVALFKMDAIQFWSTILKLVVSYGKFYIVFEIFLDQFSEFYWKLFFWQFSDNNSGEYFDNFSTYVSDVF